MFPVPRFKEELSDVTKKMIATIVGMIQVQKGITQIAMELSVKEDVNPGCLRPQLAMAFQSFFFVYREADKLMQEQEGLDYVDNYPIANWEKRMNDLYAQMEKSPEVAPALLRLVCEKIDLVENNLVPIITPEDIHASISLAIVEEAGELPEQGYLQNLAAA